MIVSVEAYAGKVGEQYGVKLEDEVLITAEGPVMLSLYPYEERDALVRAKRCCTV